MCAALTPAQLRELEGFKLSDRIVDAGTLIFREGETPGQIFTLKSGWVMLYSLLPDGRRQIHEFCVRGALLTYSVEGSVPVGYSAQAITDGTICVLPREQVSGMLHQIPAMAVSLACLAAREQARAYRHTASMGRRTAVERVAELLLDLDRRARMAGDAPLDPGQEMRLPVTQEQIGDALGLTPVHVNRTLKILREDNLVSIRAHRMRILDPGGMAAAAGQAGRDPAEGQGP